jgi:predicted RNA-binding Zn ribbon-like protein
MSDQAPGDLETLRVFVNTLELETGSDELSSPEALQGWLERHGLWRGRSASTADLDSARRLREALRDLMLENNGVSARREAALVLSEAAERGRLALRFDSAGGVRLEGAAAGVDGALGRLVAIAAAAMTDGTWRRLKACRADRCGWAFYDHARNHSRLWCSMAVCGNRTKARSYRRRHAVTPSV